MEAIIDPWILLSDVGVACILLLVAKLLRSNLKVLQRLFIPTALLAGAFGLLLGDAGLGWIHLSAGAGSYGAVLICVVFAAVGLETRFPKGGDLIRRTGPMWAYSQANILIQWIAAIIFGLTVIPVFFPDLPVAFATIIPAAFAGGHGTVMGMSDTMASLGWESFLSLGLTAATVGVFLAVIGGMFVVNIFARMGILKDVRRFDDMARHEQQGLNPRGQRVSIGDETVASSSLHVITMHLAMIVVVTFIGFRVAAFLSGLSETLSVPTFACCFLVGCLVRAVMEKLGLFEHFDGRIISSTASSATDFLIFFGISSIQLTVVLLNSVPLIVILVLGTLLCIVSTFFLGKLMLGEKWASRSIFSWGWITASLALAVLLLRVSDPKGDSEVLDDFAIAYLPASIGDIIILSLVPSLIMTGYAQPVLAVLCGCLAAVVLLYVFVIRRQTAPDASPS